MATITRIEYTAHDEDVSRWYDGIGVYVLMFVLAIVFLVAVV